VFGFGFGFYPKLNRSTEATELFTNPASATAVTWPMLGKWQPTTSPSRPPFLLRPAPPSPTLNTLLSPILSSLYFQNPIPHGHTRGQQGGGSGGPAVVTLQRSTGLGVLYLKDHGSSSPPRRSGVAGTPHAHMHAQASGSAACSLLVGKRVDLRRGWPAGGLWRLAGCAAAADSRPAGGSAAACGRRLAGGKICTSSSSTSTTN
jgi:hypothetical protein